MGNSGRQLPQACQFLRLGQILLGLHEVTGPLFDLFFQISRHVLQFLLQQPPGSNVGDGTDRPDVCPVLKKRVRAYDDGNTSSVFVPQGALVRRLSALCSLRRLLFDLFKFILRNEITPVSSYYVLLITVPAQFHKFWIDKDGHSTAVLLPYSFHQIIDKRSIFLFALLECRLQLGETLVIQAFLQTPL